MMLGMLKKTCLRRSRLQRWSKQRQTKIGKARFSVGITLVCACATLPILQWNTINSEEQKITVTTRKTRKDVTVPIHPEFASWLQEQTRGIGKAPVFLRLACKSGAGKSGLSMQFKRVM